MMKMSGLWRMRFITVYDELGYPLFSIVIWFTYTAMSPCRIVQRFVVGVSVSVIYFSATKGVLPYEMLKTSLCSSLESSILSARINEHTEEQCLGKRQPNCYHEPFITEGIFRVPLASRSNLTRYDYTPHKIKF
jgi:hypothetical protein